MGKATRHGIRMSSNHGVVLDAIRGELTLVEVVSKHGAHQTMITQWKCQAIEGLVVTSSRKVVGARTNSGDVEKLYTNIGKLLVKRSFYAMLQLKR